VTRPESHGKRPLVTVFVPVHDRERFIGATLESVLAQTLDDLELLVVDDGSRDRSVEVVQSYRDPRIRLVCNGENRGIPYTRNRGLALARGRYIALLDSDDLAHPRRLERQVAFLEGSPDVAEVGSWVRMIDAAGRPLRRTRRQPTAPEDVDAWLLFRCCLSNRSVTGRTALLREYGYREEFPRCQDYDLHVRLARRHRLANLPEVLVYGRVHPGQFTRQTDDLGRAKKREIARRALGDLGVVDVSEEDLERHVGLSRLRQQSRSPDRAELEWAADWLARLCDANRRSGRYRQAALERAVGTIWRKLCWAGLVRLGPAVGRRFLASPLWRLAVGLGSRPRADALPARRP